MAISSSTDMLEMDPAEQKKHANYTQRSSYGRRGRDGKILLQSIFQLYGIDSHHRKPHICQFYLLHIILQEEIAKVPFSRFFLPVGGASLVQKMPGVSSL